MGVRKCLVETPTSLDMRGAIIVLTLVSCSHTDASVLSACLGRKQGQNLVDHTNDTTCNKRVVDI